MNAPKLSPLRRVFEDYDAGGFATGELPGRILDVALSSDLEPQLDAIDVDRADRSMWILRDAYAPIVGHEPEKYLIVEAVTVRRGYEEEYRGDLAHREHQARQTRIPAIQAWLAARPLRAREPFPTGTIRRVLSLVTEKKQALLDGRPTDLDRKQSRAWWSDSGCNDLVHLEVELTNALRRADTGPIGSQEQALAWDGVERIAAQLVELELDGLVVAERTLLALARDHRAGRLARVRRGAEAPCHRPNPPTQ